MAQHTGILRLMVAATSPTVKLRITPYRPESKSIWDGLVQHSINGTFIHERGFMEYHGDRFEDASLIAFRANKPIAIFPAERTGNTVYSHRGLTYGGWIYTPEVTTAELKKIIGTTIAYYQNLGMKHVNLKTVPDCFAYKSQQPLLTACLSAGASIMATYSHQATLLPYRITDRGKKWGRKKALKHDLYIRQSEDWGFYWEHILCPNLCSRHEVAPTHSLAEINLLRDRFPHNIKLFGVYYGNKMLGGCVVFDTRRCAHLQYSSATAEGRSFRCLDLLVSHLIEDTYKNRDYFNFGVSYIPETDKINISLMQWKESFGANPKHNYHIVFNISEK